MLWCSCTARGEIPFEGKLYSDGSPLHPLSAAALQVGGVRILRDPTRGGIATTLKEFVENRPRTIELEEESIPVDPGVAASCELLGLDPLYNACEGRMLAVVSPEHAATVLDAMHHTPGEDGATVIGRVTESQPGRVILHTTFDGSRILGKLTGAQLPRIAERHRDIFQIRRKVYCIVSWNAVHLSICHL